VAEEARKEVSVRFASRPRKFRERGVWLSESIVRILRTIAGWV